MPKLTYWKCQCLYDSDSYSIREKTKKEATRQRDMSGMAERYSAPFKVTIQYDDRFDLLKICLNESHYSNI